MADYDSDSSLEDATTDISTNVLLGYASKEPTVDSFSQLGGLPTWLDAPDSPDGRLGKCKVCNSVLSLLLQLHGDLPDRFPGHERKLYVLGCRRKACRRKDGSVRALRAVRRYEVATTGGTQQETKRKEEPKVNLGETLFGAKSPAPAQSNPFASASTNAGTANPFAAPSASSSSAASQAQSSNATADTLAETFASKARISSPSGPSTSSSTAAPPEPWPQDPKPYTHYHLDADTEYLDPAFGTDDIPTARMDTNGESSTSNVAEEKTLFESTMDKTFQRFADRLAQNPEQVLRYEFGGTPLLYSKSDAVGKMLAPESGRVQTSSGSGFRAPRCANCGAARVFELQMTPHAIAELEAEEVAIDGMEWGTIIIGVCEEDCQQKGKEAVGEVGYVEEWVGVQWEELADHRAMR